MRVLFVTSAYPSSRSDPRGVFVHRVARSLRGEGVDVTVLAPGQAVPQGEPGPESEVEGVTVVRVPYWTKKGQTVASGLGGIVPNLRSHPKDVIKVLPLFAALGGRARSLAADADVVHAHWLYPAAMAVELAAIDRPLVVTTHGGDVNLARKVPFLGRLSGVVAGRADRCVGVSTELCQDLISFGVPAEKVVYLPYGIDHVGPDPDRGSRDGAGLRVLYVGSLIPRKSVDTLIESHRLLRGMGIPVQTTVVGAGPEMDRLQALARSADAAGISFAGERGTSEIRNFLAANDVLVLPSRSEGRPNVVLEAMAMSLPVVATDIPGTRSLVRDGATGLLFPPGDAVGLAHRLERLARDEDLRLSMGRSGWDAVDEEGLWNGDIARRYVDVYEDARRAWRDWARR